MTWFTRLQLDTDDQPVKSLAWQHDGLVDWVRGGDAWLFDGTFVRGGWSWSYGRFDAAITDSTGRWVVVHERTGTAGIVIHEGTLVREIRRSCYFADAYPYPVCLLEHAGRTFLAHCPERYDRLELEDVETGERLATSTARGTEIDIFHSRLAVSPGGTRFLSAGWVWHPADVVNYFDVDAVIANPALLDAPNGALSPRESSSAAWLDDDRILLGGPDALLRTADGPATLQPSGLSIYDTRSNDYVDFELPFPPGVMMPVGTTHVVTFFRHPRLVSLATGAVIHEWPELDTGTETSSTAAGSENPVLSLDPANARFAVAATRRIDIITIDVDALAP